MTLLSLEGTLKKNPNRFFDSELLRISQALRGLVGSLQEFREVETMLGLESIAVADHRGANDASPRVLGVVAGTLTEMVGKLVSDIEAEPEIQKLLLVIQKSGAANKGATSVTQRSSCLIGTAASGKAHAACTSGMQSRAVRRAAVERAVGCRHFCAVHPVVMDPYLWRTLPVELVQLALARLPFAKLIMEIHPHSALFTVSRSENFRRFCSERHPRLFGLVAQENLRRNGERLCNVVYDSELNKWIKRDVVGLDFCHQEKGLAKYNGSLNIQHRIRM